VTGAADTRHRAIHRLPHVQGERGRPEAGRANDRMATGRRLGKQLVLGIFSVESQPRTAPAAQIAEFVPKRSPGLSAAALSLSAARAQVRPGLDSPPTEATGGYKRA
jgi:hypothetical protein